MNKQEAINALKEHNQEHVIKRLEALDEVSAKKLIAQVASIDWSVVESINHKAEDNSSDRKVEPLEAVEIKDIKANKDKYTAKGIEAIKAGKVAAVLLAGGQGTRLGLDKPKGTLNVGINKDLFLFEQLINNLLDVVNQSGAYVPLYIMTSDKKKIMLSSLFRVWHHLLIIMVSFIWKVLTVLQCHLMAMVAGLHHLLMQGLIRIWKARALNW